MPVIDRRRLIAASTLSAVAYVPSAIPARVLAESGSGSSEAKRLNVLLDRFMDRTLQRSPQMATSLGLDKGAHADAKERLDDSSLGAAAADLTEHEERLRALRSVDRSRLSGMDAVNYDTVAYGEEIAAEAGRRFSFGGGVAGQPYVLSQLTGAYQSVPDFLDTQHAINGRADADAYLERLSAFAAVMDQEREVLSHDAGIGAAPPAFIIKSALSQMDLFSATSADDATIVLSLDRRAKAKGIAGDWRGRAAKLYDQAVLPALRRQMEALKGLEDSAVSAAGVARLPDGEAYYALSLRAATTTKLTPEEAHAIGMEEVAALNSALDAAFRAQGMAQGAPWERLRALFKDPRFLYPNTDEGKARLIRDLNAKVQVVEAKLPQWFGAVPKAKVEIRRVPKAIEAGASSNYQSGALDGSRPGAYYVVLRDTAEDPSWLMPTLTYHEAVPGHHLQGSLALEAGLPVIRNTQWFSGYGEGWALYAEQLADEMGLYAEDPWGRIGYLHDALLRAARIVMDTGIHSRGWTREQAVRYFIEHQGDPESAAVSEVERYCVWPGQACSYMIGKREWLRFRARSRRALGSRFDIRRFHDAGLLAGPTPLTVLDTIMAEHDRV